jgi:hypothetical protein
MSSPCLYINTRGEAHTKHSYSAGTDYDQSPSKYYLRRILGWRPKDDKAAFHFGRAIEKAVEYGHDNDGRGFIEKFTDLWGPAKELALKYTKLEKNWENCLSMGIDMMRLYIIRQPSLPIPLGGASVFQREYAKEIYPGDPNYGGITDVGKLDVITYNEPAHPLLPVIKWQSDWGLLRPLIVDMKTSGVNYSSRPGMAAFDKQLRRYSWQSGIRDVAFLAFIKKGRGYKKNSIVTLLVDIGPFKAGTEMLVAGVYDEDVKGAWLVNNQLAMDSMDAAQGRKEDGGLDQTKAGKERKIRWLEENAVAVPEIDFTRQRLIFNAGRVTDESAVAAGWVAGRQVRDIVNSWRNNQWPDTFGVRYPNDDTNDPYFKAFSLGDTAFKEEHFTMSNPNEMDDLFNEDEPEVEDEE